MRSRLSLSFGTLLSALALAAAVNAGTVYWDIDTLNRAGAGSSAPGGIWNASTPRWNVNADGTGIPGLWTPGDTAIFAAGSNATGAYMVIVNGTQSLAGLTLEEGTVTQSGGTLDFGSSAASIYINPGAAYGETSTGVLTGTGGLFKNGGGLLALRGANTFSRSGSGNQPFLTINAGIVDFVTDANLGAVPATTDNGAALTINGGTLRYVGSASFALATRRGVHIGDNGGTIEVMSEAILGLAPNANPNAALTGSGTLTKTGIGRFLLQTAQTTFTGKFVVKVGSLAFNNQDRLGAIPATTQADYFMLDGGGLLSENPSGMMIDAKRGITLGASGGYLAFQGTGLLPYDGIISGTQGGGLRLSTTDSIGAPNEGTISLNAANTYNGPTQIDIGTTVSVGILANGGVNSGIGSTSSAATNLIINGGKLSYRGPNASTDRNFTLTGSGGYIDASSADNSAISYTSTAPITMTGNAAHLFILSGTSTGNNSFSPAVSNFGSFVTTFNKADTGTWVLKNTANGYTGNTILSNGRLKLGASGVIPNASLVQFFNQSTLDLNGYDETVRSISGAAGTLALGAKSLTLNDPTGESFSGAVTSSGGRIVKNGAGTFTLRPTASYDGGVTVNVGALGVGTNNALGTGYLAANNDITIGSVVTTPLTFTNSVVVNGNLTFDDYTFISNPGSITWNTNGANKWTLYGGNRMIAVSSVPGTYGVTINQVIGEDVAGRALTKGGNGTLTLTAANTYTGNTTIQDGTLSLAKPSLADASTVVMASGATLNLSFPAGTPDIVNAFFIDGLLQANGTWGAIGSAAVHQTALITGSGMLNVVPLVPPISIPLLLGDFNNDGQVDIGDYITWRKKLGSDSPLPNDNGLGAPIGQAHYNLWRSRYGNISHVTELSSGRTATVPEPGVGMLLILAIAFLHVSRHRT
jgi:fibronectin-binding autotransporter adhesin